MSRLMYGKAGSSYDDFWIMNNWTSFGHEKKLFQHKLKANQEILEWELLQRMNLSIVE